MRGPLRVPTRLLPYRLTLNCPLLICRQALEARLQSFDLSRGQAPDSGRRQFFGDLPPESSLPRSSPRSLRAMSLQHCSQTTLGTHASGGFRQIRAQGVVRHYLPLVLLRGSCLPRDEAVQRRPRPRYRVVVHPFQTSNKPLWIERRNGTIQLPNGLPLLHLWTRRSRSRPTSEVVVRDPHRGRSEPCQLLLIEWFSALIDPFRVSVPHLG